MAHYLSAFVRRGEDTQADDVGGSARPPAPLAIQRNERHRDGASERMCARATAVRLPSQMPEWDHYSKILDIVPDAEQRASTQPAIAIALWGEKEGGGGGSVICAPTEEVVTERGS